jgi:intracellular septation protein A
MTTEQFTAPGPQFPSPHNARVAALTPLIVDVGLPLGAFYLLSDGFGVATITALTVSSVPPAASALWTAVKKRKVNGLAGLMLVVNVVGILMSVITGDPRLMLAKDGAISSVIGIAVLLSVAAGRPLMSAAMKPMVVRGDSARLAAWDRLSATSGTFRRSEKSFSLVWGTALLTECVVRVVCAYTLPVHTVVWLHAVLVLGAIAVGMVGSRAFAERIGKLVKAEAAGAAGVRQRA